MKALTEKQRQIYDYIISFQRDHGYPPSVREIGEHVGLKSPSTVHFHLKGLEAAGLITKAEGKTRAITVAGGFPPSEADPPADRVPVVGNVAAGSPILAEQCIEDYLAFDTGGLTGEHFALRVRGESMLYAGILPGDYVVVHQQEHFRTVRSWWPFLRMRLRSRPCAGRTDMSGSCRRIRSTSPLTAMGPSFWARWWP